MKKNILTLAALLIASATMFTACSGDDNVLDGSAVETPARQTYTMTVQASKGDGATTRALSLDGSTLNATWAEGEAVTVYNKTKGNDLTGMLTAQGSGANTTLRGELTGTIEAGDVLKLKFLSPAYSSQDGTLTGSANSIDKVCDYAEATVTVASVAGGNITTTAEADFVNQQAIVKFTLKDKGNSDAAISATQLVVSDGTNDYTVTPSSATDVLYVALPDISSKTLTLTATVGSDTYTYEKAGVTFQNGQYYEITVKMTKQAPAARALATATAEDLGKIAGADGNIYDTQAAATTAGTTAVAMIAYVGSETDNTTYTHGLAIALADESVSNWSTAKTICEGKTAVTGAAWLLPSQKQWKAMFKANGGNEGSYTGLNTAITTAGGTALQERGYYWSSTERDDVRAYDVELYVGVAYWYNGGKGSGNRVRACLAF